MTEEQLLDLASSREVVVEEIDSAPLTYQPAPVKAPPTMHQTVGPCPLKT
jgi:hypothetical protein